MILELLLAERNHVCSVCVANGHCELQDQAAAAGVDHVRYEYQYPLLPVDVSHERFGVDHNRCVLCTRCVRACDEIEGAHTWDVAGRGAQLPRHHRPEPAVGRGGQLYLLRQVRPGLPDRRALPPRLDGGGDGPRPRAADPLVTAREKKQWIV